VSKPRILLQLDTDDHTSVFDSVVAVDAGVEHLLRQRGVTPGNVRDQVHGAIFTRGPADLRQTAIFIGGSDVSAAEAVLAEVRKSFFGPLRVSVMLDPSGANSTAAAAVWAAARHAPLKGATVLVLAATGPVGQRVTRLLAREGADVRVASRDRDRAQTVCDRIGAQVASGASPVPHERLTAWATSSAEETAAALAGAEVVIAAGAAAIELASQNVLRGADRLRVAVDLNAVPPVGLGGIEPHDRGAERDGLVCYGAIGVGGTKMKVHKAAIARLFEANDLVLDAEELLEIARGLS
jgi:methylenetetrahydrofolate/methylenetetrahydromethanopterin dehydrogenase (NADP+)